MAKRARVYTYLSFTGGARVRGPSYPEGVFQMDPVLQQTREFVAARARFGRVTDVWFELRGSRIKDSWYCPCAEIVLQELAATQDPDEKAPPPPDADLVKVIRLRGEAAGVVEPQKPRRMVNLEGTWEEIGTISVRERLLGRALNSVGWSTTDMVEEIEETTGRQVEFPVRVEVVVTPEANSEFSAEARVWQRVPEKRKGG